MPNTDNNGGKGGKGGKVTGKNPYRDEKGRFLKGNPGSPGRPKGSIGADRLLRMTLEALDELGGKEYLIEQGRTHPRAFLAFLSKVLPRDIKLQQQDAGWVIDDLINRRRQLQGQRDREAREARRPPLRTAG